MMKKRFLSLILAMLLVFNVLPTAALAADVVTSGICGENLTWELTSDGVLTISGTGEMYNYSLSSGAPWSKYAYLITSVAIEKGVTGIGALAFSGCTGLIRVDIPTSVTRIEQSHFGNV